MGYTFILSNIKPMKLTSQQEKAFQEAKFCSMCLKPLDQHRVWDHSHISGAYRDAAHSNCNLNYKESKKIAVIFHNLNAMTGTT